MNLNSQTIFLLLVEDSPEDTLFVRESLERAHSERFHITSVSRLSDAVAHLKQDRIDAILLDLGLPDSDGLASLHALLPLAADRPILVLTGLIDEQLAMQTLKEGAQDFIVKGETPSSILEHALRKAIERQQLVQTLTAKETRIREMIEENSDGIVVIDQAGIIRFANPAAEKIFGRPTGELIGIAFGFPIIGKDRTEIGVIHTQGNTIDVELNAVDFDWNEQPALLVSLRDITLRKQAERALREKEQLLAEAERIGQMGSWRYDIATNTMQFSDEIYRLLDISKQEFPHNSEALLDLIYPSDRSLVAKWINDIRTGKQVGEVEFLVLRKNSELRYFRCRGVVEFDYSGNPTHFTGTAQDVTERKFAEIQIHQQLERLTALRKIDQAISSSFDLNVTLAIVISQVISQLQVDAADILLMNADGNILDYAAGKGFRTNAIQSGRLLLSESTAIRERRLVHVESLEKKPDGRLLSPQGASEGFVCSFRVPLIVKGAVKGVLELFHRAPFYPYAEWIDFLNTLAGQAAIAIENATLFENLENSNRELFLAYDATIEGWSLAMDLRDKETEGHTRRVTEMTLRLARAMKIDESRLIQIRRGALLHDIGKLGVPDAVLLKADKLTDEEWKIMRQHPQLAYDMLSPIRYLASALNIPYCHHEKWDGTGYPRGLKGEQIPLEARIFAVVDVWDALRSDRPYRNAWSAEETREYIRTQAGSHFDPKVVECFLELIKE